MMLRDHRTRFLIRPASTRVILSLFLTIILTNPVEGNPDAKRLYDDLLSHYNRLIRPVSNNSQVVTVRLGLHLTQLVDLDLKNQILTTNVWVEHEWLDQKLTWDPEEYGGVDSLMVPSEHIWLPDIVLYNNADGEYVVTVMTKAILHYDGNVKWNPPAIFKSYCEIDVRYFPFDTQTCFMKFGSWSYSGLQMDLKHIHTTDDLVKIGMNLKDYYPSGEWDILDVPAERHARFYECCPNEFYADIFFNITLRRKTLFYTVNLIIPCVGISCLSVLTFYLPADSGEKVALCITTLLSQTMFFLLMSEIIPSTSLAMPLLGKYLLFTMCLVGLSVLITIVILNVRYRKPSTHRMAPWVRKFFIQQLPRKLFMRVPNQSEESDATSTDATNTSKRPTSSSRRVSGSGSFNQSFGVGGNRRWSRTGIPGHYGSQLLCEIIKKNASSNRASKSPSSVLPEGCRLPSPPPTPVATADPSPMCSFFVPPPPLLADPQEDEKNVGSEVGARLGRRLRPVSGTYRSSADVSTDGSSSSDSLMVSICRPKKKVKRYPIELQKAIRDIQFIQNHMKREDEYDEEDNDWGFIAMVLDRFFLWVFTLASLCGTISILLTAPALYDFSSPINSQFAGESGGFY